MLGHTGPRLCSREPGSKLPIPGITGSLLLDPTGMVAPRRWRWGRRGHLRHARLHDPERSGAARADPLRQALNAAGLLTLGNRDQVTFR